MGIILFTLEEDRLIEPILASFLMNNSIQTITQNSLNPNYLMIRIIKSFLHFKDHIVGLAVNSRSK